jgi:integrase
MSVRRRKWKTSKGEEREAWVVRYGSGKDRHIATFDRKKEADDYHAKVRVDRAQGIHIAPSQSITVEEAGRLWIEAGEAAGLERTTLDTYRSYLDFHVLPFLANVKLSTLTVTAVKEFQNKLRLDGRSHDMMKRTTRALGAILAEAQERGKVAQNVVRSLKQGRRGKDRQAERRAKGKLRVGVDIPSPAEIDAILGAAGQWRPFFLVAARCGLRASELRALRWEDIDLKRGTMHVCQRADEYNEIGPTKSEASNRTIPIPPTTLAALREWKLKCPRRDKELHYVFPNGAGNVENRRNIVIRAVGPIQIRAGVAVTVKDANGKSVKKPKYPGLHAFRHFFASWCINRKVDGGLELPAKVVQERLGHSSIVMTMDTYGHLFPSGDDSAALAAAEGRFG